ncbi:MAG: LysM peptidoglycan-binding domain-containing protein [Rubricoccaceae bacterium]|nr:LysM peptidoglycan-binding domain-containing protein [Rubricoccaceae bacterium]
MMKIRTAYLLFSAIILLAFIGVPSSVAQGSVEQRISDLRLETTVKLALLEDSRTNTFEIEVQAADGVVVLIGLVPSYQDWTLVNSKISALAQLGTLRNDIRLETQPDVPVVDRTELESDVADVNPSEEIAEPSAAAEYSEPVYHLVRQGDTLYSIARRYGTTLAAIQDLNGMRDTVIRVGQRVRVR